MSSAKVSHSSRVRVPSPFLKPSESMRVKSCGRSSSSCASVLASLDSSRRSRCPSPSVSSRLKMRSACERGSSARWLCCVRRALASSSRARWRFSVSAHVGAVVRRPNATYSSSDTEPFLSWSAPSRRSSQNLKEAGVEISGRAKDVQGTQRARGGRRA